MNSSIKQTKKPSVFSNPEAPGPTSWDEMRRVKEEEYFEKQNREKLKKLLTEKSKDGNKP